MFDRDLPPELAGSNIASTANTNERIIVHIVFGIPQIRDSFRQMQHRRKVEEKFHLFGDWSTSHFWFVEYRYKLQTSGVAASKLDIICLPPGIENRISMHPSREKNTDMLTDLLEKKNSR